MRHSTNEVPPFWKSGLIIYLIAALALPVGTATAWRKSNTPTKGTNDSRTNRLSNRIIKKTGRTLGQFKELLASSTALLTLPELVKNVAADNGKVQIIKNAIVSNSTDLSREVRDLARHLTDAEYNGLFDELNRTNREVLASLQEGHRHVSNEFALGIVAVILGIFAAGGILGWLSSRGGSDGGGYGGSGGYSSESTPAVGGSCGADGC